jgi:inosose dehydratase
MTVRLGTNPIAWSNDDLPELGGDTPLETCLAEVRQAGFSGIEKGNKFPADAAATKAVLGGYGLELVSGWYGAELRCRDVDQELAAMRPHLDLLKGCGCKVMVFAETSGTVQGRRDTPVSDRPVMREHEWPVFLDRLGRLGDWMAGEGVRIAFHHHMGTVIEKAHEIDHMLEGTPDSVGLLFDTGHLRFAGEDPAAIARRWAHRINHVHAKDTRPDILARAHAERWSFLDAVVAGVYTVPGDGAIDFVPCLAPLAAAGYAGWLIVEAEQDPARADPLTYARKGYTHLRNVAEAVGFTVEQPA